MPVLLLAAGLIIAGLFNAYIVDVLLTISGELMNSEVYVHQSYRFILLLVSLAAVPLILMSTRFSELREFWTILASVLKFGLVISLLPAALEGRIAEYTLFQIAPGVGLTLRVDQFGIFFASLLRVYGYLLPSIQ
jgi:hypothetical protein